MIQVVKDLTGSERDVMLWNVMTGFEMGRHKLNSMTDSKIRRHNLRWIVRKLACAHMSMLKVQSFLLLSMGRVQSCRWGGWRFLIFSVLVDYNI